MAEEHETEAEEQPETGSSENGASDAPSLGRVAAFTAAGAVAGAAAAALRARRRGDSADEPPEPEGREAEEPDRDEEHERAVDPEDRADPEAEAPDVSESDADEARGEAETEPEPDQREARAEPVEARGEDDVEPAETADSGEAEGREETEGGDEPRSPAVAAARRARQQLAQLTGREVEGVAGVERAGEGWRVLLEVVEVSRVPQTTDVLGLYEVELDGDAELVSYDRRTRYLRAQAEGSDA